ncbi:unnamed protein product [Cochlearia groenlandica]
MLQSTTDCDEENTKESQVISQATCHEKSRLSSSRYVPLELTWDILSRLPSKSIVRFLAVSKLWSSIITNQDFIKNFSSRSSRLSSKPCVLLALAKGNTRFVFSFPQNQNPNDLFSGVELYEELINPSFDYSINPYLDSVHGLICFKTCSHQLMIWNPTMRKSFALPKLEDGLGCLIMFLGYDPVESKYKVLSFFSSKEFRVVTLGVEESWRVIKPNPMFSHWPTKTSHKKCINGVIYYKSHSIISFDLKFETFDVIELPEDTTKSSLMIDFDGKLAIVSSMASGVKIWILEDVENKKWSYKQFHYPPFRIRWTHFDLKGVNDDCELVYTPKILGVSFRVVYFDPKKMSVRQTMFKGIFCGEFRRLKGLGFGPLKIFDVFPNHIESIFSF